MMTWRGRFSPIKAAATPALAVMLVGSAQVALTAPALAQDTMAEVRMRKMEAEIRALQRKVFPGAADGRLFQPEIAPGQSTTPQPGTPSTTAVTDLLTRMDSVEAQLARLTAQIEQTTNRLTQLEARMGTGAENGTGTAPAAADANLSAMSGGASTPATSATPASITPTPAPAPAPAGPSAQRLAAVRAIEKPSTSDAGDDEYSYGFRLWDAKFYPEAQQQLKMFVDRYPRHSRISFGRNLLGRAYLDEGKPRDAATWFLQNYQADKRGARAPDSLLYLAESMRQLKDTTRGCIALAEFSETYAAEAAGRLKSEYEQTRKGLKCHG